MDTTSNIALRSRPIRSASAKASQTPIIEMPSTMLLQILAACPEPAGPQRTIFLPIAARNGPAGSGQAAKICNNMVLGISMIGVCEAFALADRMGLDRKAMFDVVSTSSGSCWSINTYCPVPGVGPQSPADNDYAPGFAAALMLKDLRLAREAATSTGARTPLGSHAAEIYEAFVAEGHGGKDFSAVILALSGGAKS